MDSSQDDRRSILARYFSEIRGHQIQSEDEEQDLVRAFQKERSRDAFNRLVEANLSFVVKVASEYRNLGMSFENLLEAGNLGLIEAVLRYDATKRTRFITYAIWWIRKSILKELSERSGLVRVPSYQMKRVRETAQRAPSLPPKETHSRDLRLQIRRAMQEENTSLVGLLDRGHDSRLMVMKYLVHSALGRLSPRESSVVRLRFGLDGLSPKTRKDVSELVGAPEETVGQIEAEALQTLYGCLAPEPPRIIVPALEEINNTLLDYLRNHPEEMHNLRSRMFEKLIADILATRGWNVELTGKSRDNGVDIVAVSSRDNIPIQVIVQCKRYRPENRVGLSVIKELYASKIDLGASMAMAVTTSWFTRPAREFEKRHQFELDLKNFNDIVLWLRSASN